jgi:hypothetical protein
MFSLPIHKEDIHGPIGGILVAHTGQLINPTTSNQAGPTVHHVVTLADRKITSDNARKKKTIPQITRAYGKLKIMARFSLP